MALDALLTPCSALIQINSRPVDTSVDRTDRDAYISMRESSRPILDAVDRHGGLHLVIIGTLRVHPQWEPGEAYYGDDSTLAPRDTAAEGQLWMEENALERAEAERPVSIVRASNVQGVPLEGPRETACCTGGLRNVRLAGLTSLEMALTSRTSSMSKI